MWNIAAYSFFQLEANHVVSAAHFNIIIIILLRHYSLLILVGVQKIIWFFTATPLPQFSHGALHNDIK